MILCLHYLGFGGALKVLTLQNFNFYIANALESSFIIAVDCFILITGFYQINSKFNYNKLFILWKQVFFYSILISATFWLFKLEPVTIPSVIGTFFPIITGRYWFITVYIMLYCFSPFINTALNKMEKNTHEKLLLVLTIFFVILPSIPLPPSNAYFTDNGYTLSNFVFLYCVGAYLNKYNFPSENKINFLLLYFICSFLIFIGAIIDKFLNLTVFKIAAYNFIFIEISAISLFIFFKSIKLKSQKINTIATSVFGIYLLSSNKYVLDNLYEFLRCRDYFYSPFLLLHMTISLILVFTVCLVIESFRRRLFIIMSNFWKEETKPHLLQTLYKNQICFSIWQYLKNLYRL